ncbi:hypothetical protein [Prolixibacter sp. SD074]|uniref:hypothetical protein n=1 Tax=Prolixibacter sp. SD074 TaxID=2652391 RepID=UPI0012993D21|nr:hypothetical protein [Prolixibacter sp. SD074]
MKKIIIISILAILTSMAGIATASDYPDEYLGLPGDNLNLYATMKLFQESETLEGFERSVNDPNLHINNLDLNGDNLVDYISVVDYVDGNVHTIVLRTQLNRNETQDIAVFTVQRFDDGTARIQLIGDEALYGKNYIVEPIYADSHETPNPGYMGGSVVIDSPSPVVVTTYEVAAWPIIRFIYRPGYVCWHSIWGWGHYPSYWNPWRPYYWHTYYGYHSHFDHYYYAHYRHWNHPRYHRYHDFYYRHVRAYSPKVNARIRTGNYRTTYSRPDLRRRGDDIYRQTAGRSTEYRTDNSNPGRTNSSRQFVRNRTTETPNLYSGRRTVSGAPSRTRTNSSVNRGAVDTRRSSTIQSGRSTANPSRGSKNTVLQRRSGSSSSYGTGTRSSVSIQRQSPQKTTINNSRLSGSSTIGQSYRQPKQSHATYSSRSSSKPRVSTTSSGSRSSYRQPKVSSRRQNSSSRSPSVTNSSSRSSSNRSPSVKRSRSSNSRSSKATTKSSHSRSSSGRRSGRR